MYPTHTHIKLEILVIPVKQYYEVAGSTDVFTLNQQFYIFFFFSPKPWWQNILPTSSLYYFV